jgi:hypothetical protein
MAVATALVATFVLDGFAGAVAAQKDCGTACLDPGGDGPAVDAGPPDSTTPVVDLFLKTKKAFDEDFRAFLTAKKASDAPASKGPCRLATR